MLVCIQEWSLRSALYIAKTCSTASIILTNVKHVFDGKIQKALSNYLT